ncbi:MAG: flagellar protein FlaG [Bryobacteraceae bacterium]
MDITSLQPAAFSPTASSQVSQVSVQEAAQRRQLLQAAKSVNESGVLGQNQLEFLLDRQTHRAVIRVVDRTTQQVVSQIPPEYVLQLAQDLGSSAKVIESEDDMEG